jgi:capsular polysaccharide transport system permease protein
MVAAVYLFTIAADQYVSEFRFSLSSIDPPRLDPLSLLAGNASHSPAALESQIVVQYMSSRAIVDQLDASLDLRRMFSPPDADWWARLPRPTSVEALVLYWRGQVDPFYDPANGTVVVRARAFTPPEALQLAQAIVAASDGWSMICRREHQHDTVRNAEAEVTQAETRLKAVLGEIRAFRDRGGPDRPGQDCRCDWNDSRAAARRAGSQQYRADDAEELHAR